MAAVNSMHAVNFITDEKQCHKLSVPAHRESGKSGS
jgi:hypothetical protein